MGDNNVGPLYEHVFPPFLAPSIGFVGLPWKVRCGGVATSIFLGVVLQVYGLKFFYDVK